MFVSVDWISFTFEREGNTKDMVFDLWGRAARRFSEQYPLAHQMLINGMDWTPRAGRAPYSAGQQRGDNGVMIFASTHLPHALVEIGGIGCDSLGSLDAELALIQEVAPSLTRLDIAVDIFTEVQPDDFAAHRTTGHFKAWSEALSSSGHTVYIGSKSSDRYARVYRYFDPHPRASFLRVEHVLRSEQARSAVAQIGEVGLETFVAMLGNSFGWEHPIWNPAAESAEAAKAWRPERRSGKTVAWVYSQVVPALGKLVTAGVLTPEEIAEALMKVGVDIRGDV